MGKYYFLLQDHKAVHKQWQSISVLFKADLTSLHLRVQL